MYIQYIHIPIYNPIQLYIKCTNIKYRILWSIRLQEVINKVLSCLTLWVGATWCYGLLKALLLRAVCQSLFYVKRQIFQLPPPDQLFGHFHKLKTSAINPLLPTCIMCWFCRLI